MGESEKPPRGRIQFHLATALFLTLVAGAWIGLNVRSDTDFTGGPILLPGLGSGGSAEPLRRVRRSFGLPYPFLIILYHVPDSFCSSGRSPAGVYPAQGWRFEPAALAFDLFAFIGLLLLAGILSEWLFRQRAFSRRGAGSTQ